MVDPLGALRLRRAKDRADAVNVDGRAPDRRRAALHVEIGPGKPEHFGDPPALDDENGDRSAQPFACRSCDQPASFLSRESTRIRADHPRRLRAVDRVRQNETKFDGLAENLAKRHPRIGNRLGREASSKLSRLP